MKLTIWKFFAFICFVSVICLTCKKEEQKIDFRNPASAACVLTKVTNNEDTTQYFYNSENHVTKISTGTNNYKNVIYNSEGKISQIDEFTSGVKDFYTTFEWNDKQIEVIYYQLYNTDWQGNYKDVYELNDNLEVIKMTEYSLDADNVSWIESGDYYLYEWVNSNIVKAENWDNYSVIGKKKSFDNNKPFNSGLLKSAKEVYNRKRENASKSDGYNLYATTLFEYDNNINPFRYLTVGNLYMPDVFNFSLNNWTLVTYTNINDQSISYQNSYEYNDKIFPVKLEVVKTWIISGNTVITNFSQTYEYNCR